jgi:diguanylate cyclase (GGDEF)-like protein/PAS domain S-box-containing protein
VSSNESLRKSPRESSESVEKRADDRYRGLFENSPISLWEEDFSAVRHYLDELGVSEAEELRRLFEARPEEIRRCASLVRVVDVNEATVELLECRDKEHLIQGLSEIFHEDTYKVFKEEVLALAEGKTTFEADIVNRTFQGNEIDVRMRMSVAPSHEETWSKVFVSLTDISDWKRAEERLRLQSVAIESAANAVFITTRDGTIEWVNEAFTRLSGFSREEVLGKTPRVLKSNHHGPDFYQHLWQTLLAGKVYRNHFVNRRKDGSCYTVEATITPISNEGNEISHFVAVHEDVTERLRSEKRLLHLAQYDSLTNLPNRYTLNDRLERELYRVSRSTNEVCVLLLDLDNFKDVNDAYGHLVGDALLVRVAKRLLGAVRREDTVARLGGDEFAIIQTDVKQTVGAAVLAERLLALFAEPFEVEEYRIVTSASIGISVSRSGRTDTKELLKQADTAMYRAKHSGRNTFVMHAEEMDREIENRMLLGQALRDAVEAEEFFLEYQPKIDLKTRRIVGVEALIRWRHPERGRVSPAEFVPIAENTGLILPMGKWVLRNAAGEVNGLQEHSSRELSIAINVSAVQVRHPDFVGTVTEVLEEMDFPAHLLELEVTENLLLQRTPQLEQNLRGLRELGVGLTVDDFGTGYSSLSYLRKFSFDNLKIDRSFLNGVETNPHDAAIVSAIIALSSKLGIKVIAEGVETPGQVEFLVSRGCDEAQGFYFSRPISMADVVEALTEEQKQDRTMQAMGGHST